MSDPWLTSSLSLGPLPSDSDDPFDAAGLQKKFFVVKATFFLGEGKDDDYM